MDRQAYGYGSLPRLHGGDAEDRLRSAVMDCGREHDVFVRNVFVDYRDESPYAFAALREILRRRGDVRAVVLPDLSHVAHIATVAGLSRAGLARYLGVAVLLANPAPAPTPPTATIWRIR